MSKYDKKIMDVVVDGKKVGELVQKQTAEEYSKEHWELCHFKKLWETQLKNCKNVFRTPIIKDRDE